MPHRPVLKHTHTHGDHKLRFGHPLPFGASLVPGGINFSIYSANATTCTLVLFKRGADQPFVEIPFPPELRIGDVFAMIVFEIDSQEIEYGYRFDGPSDPGNLHRFDPARILLDPLATAISGANVWGQPADLDSIYPHRARIVEEDFDWGHDRPLQIPEADLVIYEMHVRGFTRHDSSGVTHPGTFEGIREKIPYFQSIGVNCIELLPIFEFDESENNRSNPLTGESLCNYWGYSTVGFNAPKAGYAATGPTGDQANEVKALVRDLHAAGIQIVLDVVFNHTAEGNENGPTISFRGIDNKTYYMLLPDGSYANYTGCGNTVNCNHPIVRNFVRDTLRYWAAEYHIDGFRFDLASVLGRDADGAPLADPPLIEDLAHDPVLANCNLIAEAWDAGGLYQVGNFPDYGRWTEWNGKYRDAARRFLKGDPGVTGEIAQCLMGSPDLYRQAGRQPTASINFITCHDGFTLADLYAYNEKHNLENGEANRDGSNDNLSWNCGAEGPTDNPEINALRLRLQKNALALLLLSQGIPMIYMGDECGRTQRGNNNAYCQDEPWNWFDWSLTENNGLLDFMKKLTELRSANPALRQPTFLTGGDRVGSGYADISWHGNKPWLPNFSASSRTLAFLLCGRHAAQLPDSPPHFLYVAMNMFWDSLEFELPVLPKGLAYHSHLDTATNEPSEPADGKISLTGRSIQVLIGK